MTLAYSVHIKLSYTHLNGGVWFYLYRGSSETRIIGWDSLCLLPAVVSLLQYFRYLPLGSVNGRNMMEMRRGSRNYLRLFICVCPLMMGKVSGFHSGWAPSLRLSRGVESQTDALSLPQIIYAWGRWSWERSCSTGQKVKVGGEDAKGNKSRGCCNTQRGGWK